MTDFNYKRLEDLIESTWRGKDEKKCLWWQGEWWSWARFTALTDDCAGKSCAPPDSPKDQRLALLLPELAARPRALARLLASRRRGSRRSTHAPAR